MSELEGFQLVGVIGVEVSEKGKGGISFSTGSWFSTLSLDAQEKLIQYSIELLEDRIKIIKGDAK